MCLIWLNGQKCFLFLRRMIAHIDIIIQITQPNFNIICKLDTYIYEKFATVENVF